MKTLIVSISLLALTSCDQFMTPEVPAIDSTATVKKVDSVKVDSLKSIVPYVLDTAK